MGTNNSRLQGFYQLNPFERLQVVKSFDGLVDEDLTVDTAFSRLSVPTR